jgi:hypothetical protein
MRIVLSVARSIAILLVVGAASSAQAAPLVYNFTSGTARVTATYGALTIASSTIVLNGTQVTFDTSPASLTSFQFTAPTTVIPLLSILSGTSLTLSGLSVVPGAGYSNLSVTGPFAPPTTYNYTVGPVAATGTAAFTGAITAGPSAFSQTNAALSGQIRLGGGGELALNGITLGVMTLPAAGIFPGGNVTLKADVIFNGIVPEPGTAMLMGLGIAGLAARRRSS